MIPMYNAIIEKNHQKITECIRMSLKDSLFDFLSKKSVWLLFEFLFVEFPFNSVQENENAMRIFFFTFFACNF